MFEDIAAVARVFAQCLEAAAIYHGSLDTQPTYLDVERTARHWFDVAMLLGEEVADADAEKHREGE